MSARDAVASQQGVDEEMLAEVDHYPDSTFSPFQKAALELADAYLGSPADMGDRVRETVAAQLSPAQVIEVVVKLVGFSNDKVMVALGIDFDEVKPFTM